MIRQANQRFGTLDLIMLVVLCGTVSSVVGASIAGFLHDTRPARTRATAETLVGQIRQQRDASYHSQAGSERSPASVSDVVPPLTEGQIGRDSWGRPFHYSVLGHPHEAHPMIAVWSDGPNGKPESNISELEEVGTKAFHFKGDDLGFIAAGEAAR